jgi:hypothetical protein
MCKGVFSSPILVPWLSEEGGGGCTAVKTGDRKICRLAVSDIGNGANQGTRQKSIGLVVTRVLGC